MKRFDGVADRIDAGLSDEEVLTVSGRELAELLDVRNTVSRTCAVWRTKRMIGEKYSAGSG